MRLIPTPPAPVVIRKMNTLGELLNSSMCAWRLAWLVSPSSVLAPQTQALNPQLQSRAPAVCLGHQPLYLWCHRPATDSSWKQTAELCQAAYKSYKEAPPVDAGGKHSSFVLECMAANFGRNEQTIHGPSDPSAIAVRLQTLLRLLYSLQVQVAASSSASEVHLPGGLQRLEGSLAEPVHMTAAGLSQCRSAAASMQAWYGHKAA